MTVAIRSSPGRCRRALLAAVACTLVVSAGPTACRRADEERPAGAWRVDVIQLDDDQASLDALEGVRDGLREARLEAGRDYVLILRPARGDSAVLAGLVEQAVRERAQVLVTVSTLALKAALEHGGGLPVVFTQVANPTLAGVQPATRWRRWLPWWEDEHVVPVTGAYAAPGFRELVGVVRRMVGVAGPIGTVYAPADADAVFYRDALIRAARDAALQVEALPVATSAEVPAAVAMLVEKRVGALVALGDRVTNVAFGSPMASDYAPRVPVFGVLRAHVQGGAVAVAARDCRGAGRDAGLRLARVLRGEAAADLSIGQVRGMRLIINAAAAERVDLGIPLTLIARADEVIGD